MSELREAARQERSFRLCNIQDGRAKYLTCTGEGYNWSGSSLTFLADGPDDDSQLWLAISYDLDAWKLKNVKWGLYLCAHQGLTGQLVFSHLRNLEADQTWFCRSFANGFFDLENTLHGVIFPSSKWCLELREHRSRSDARVIPTGDSRRVSLLAGAAATGAAVVGLGYMLSEGQRCAEIYCRSLRSAVADDTLTNVKGNAKGSVFDLVT